MAPASNSPAIDQGAGFGLGVDQRGVIRPIELPSIPNSTAPGADGSDIGAFELQPSNALVLGKLKKNKKKGTATLTAFLPQPSAGTLTLYGKGLRTRKATITGQAQVKLNVSGKRTVNKALRKRGKRTVQIKVTYVGYERLRRDLQGIGSLQRAAGAPFTCGLSWPPVWPKVPTMRGATARSPLRFRRLRRVVPIAAVVLLSFGANARAATVTVGSPLTQPFVSVSLSFVLTVANSRLPEPEAHVKSPISGTIVRWRVLDAQGGPFKLRVLRPAGGAAYTDVGTSSPETPPGLGVQTFATNLPIQADDLIGLDTNAETDKIGAIPVLGGEIVYWVPPLHDGATLPPTNMVDEREVAFNADVQPPPSVSSISPGSGPSRGGTAVTIAGSDFAGVSAVSFGGLPAASYSVGSESQMVAKSPAARPGPVDVTVTTVAGRSATGPAGVFTYRAALVCKVPKLKRRRLRAARRALRKRHCRLGKVTRRRRARAPRRAKIVSQRPKPGAIRPAGFRVKVTLLVRKEAERK
jgi:IPT/TIG domain